LSKTGKAPDGRSTVEVSIMAFVERNMPRGARDELTVEEPMEIRICREGMADCRTISVTMRTPGRDVELSAGFLFTEGIIKSVEDILSIGHPGPDDPNSRNAVEASISDERYRESSGYTRSFNANSSCGVCGKSNINEIFLKGRKVIRSTLSVSASTILSLPGIMTGEQAIFSKTGGAHAAALFSVEGKLLAVEEDVGRHNAVDKAIGKLLLGKLADPSGCILQASGRAGFEIVQKAIVAGIPVISSVSAPTSLAVEAAEAFNATVIGFARNGRFNVYTHSERVVP